MTPSPPSRAARVVLTSASVSGVFDPSLWVPHDPGIGRPDGDGPASDPVPELSPPGTQLFDPFPITSFDPHRAQCVLVRTPS